MPKQRPPFDYENYLALDRQGLSKRAIAEQMGMPESTLRDNVKFIQRQQEPHQPMVHQGRHTVQEPQHRAGEVHISIPAYTPVPVPEGDTGVRQIDLEQALPGLSQELGDMLGWWRTRQQVAQEPTVKLERATYHVDPRWIAAIKQEADRTGDSYAAVVNRAFRAYFAGRQP